MLDAELAHRCCHLGELFAVVRLAEVEVGEGKHHELAKFVKELADHLAVRSFQSKVKFQRRLDQIQPEFQLRNDEAQG